MSSKHNFSLDTWDFKSSSVLAGLPPEEQALLTANMSEQLYRKGEIIFREGGFPTGIFYIREGKVKKYKADRDGREQIIYVSNTGEMIGYHALLAEERYHDMAAALEDSRISFIPKEDFLQVLDHSPVLSRRLLKTFSHEYSVFVSSVALFAQRSVRERFALQLMVMREKSRQHLADGAPVVINMSREDLASLVGTARENIVRILKDFKNEGIVETKGRKIMVTDIDKLLAIIR